MPAPTHVLFDLDGVLSHYDHSARVTTLAARTGKSAADAHAALSDSGLERETDLGLWQTDEHVSELGRRIEGAITLEDCIAARTNAMRVNEDVLSLARYIAGRAHVAIVTNNGLLLRDHLATMCPSLFPLFAGNVFCSAQFGVAKPEPAIFERCLEALGAEPSRTLFIDDKAINAEGARRAGLIAIHFTDAASLARELALHGLCKETSHAS